MNHQPHQSHINPPLFATALERAEVAYQLIQSGMDRFLIGSCNGAPSCCYSELNAYATSAGASLPEQFSGSVQLRLK